MLLELTEAAIDHRLDRGGQQLVVVMKRQVADVEVDRVFYELIFVFTAVCLVPLLDTPNRIGIQTIRAGDFPILDDVAQIAVPLSTDRAQA